MAGLEIPVLPYRRHIAVTGTFPAVPRNNPMTVDFQSSLYFHPEGDGVLIGMSDRDESPGFSTDVNWEFLEKTFGKAARGAPASAGVGGAAARRAGGGHPFSSPPPRWGGRRRSRRVGAIPLLTSPLAGEVG